MWKAHRLHSISFQLLRNVQSRQTHRARVQTGGWWKLRTQRVDMGEMLWRTVRLAALNIANGPRSGSAAECLPGACRALGSVSITDK